MKDEEKWPTLHAYRRAVASNKAPVIICPYDREELYPIVGTDGDPELKCFYCRTVFDIGLDVWDQINSNLRDLDRND